MKKILIITSITIVCLLAIYIYFTGGYIRYPYMFYRYNKVITEPLAKMGNTDAQWKMGIYWFEGVGEMEIPKEDLEQAIYWWEKAAAKGHKGASKALAEAEKMLAERDDFSKEAKNKIYEIAKSIIDNKDNNENIGNLYGITTTSFFTTEDYFTNSETKNRLVLISGEAGTSSGTARNLLILFSGIDTYNVIWSGQVSEFIQDDIVDINGDGIKEIVMNSGWVWMGYIGEYYQIFNFKNGKKNDIFTVRSTSVLDCDYDGNDVFMNYPDLYKQGDTLENKFDCSLIKLNDTEYGVKQIHTVKIHNGGQTEQEILKKVKVFSDTTNIKLK